MARRIGLCAPTAARWRAPWKRRHLGKASALPASPEEAVLDYVPNPRPGALYLVRFAAPEFTSLCPVTGQPDFAHLVIDYAPGETIVESKSLKLFLGSFRNHCGFHEDVTVGIGQRLAEEMKPQWLRIGGYWYPRGGMPIDVFWQSGPPPEGLWLPDQGVAPYRGRVADGGQDRDPRRRLGRLLHRRRLGRRRGCRSRFIGRPKHRRGHRASTA